MRISEELLDVMLENNKAELRIILDSICNATKPMQLEAAQIMLCGLIDVSERELEDAA